MGRWTIKNVVYPNKWEGGHVMVSHIMPITLAVTLKYLNFPSNQDSTRGKYLFHDEGVFGELQILNATGSELKLGDRY